MIEWTLLPLDCRLAMRLCMAPDSIDSVCTDPPYDLTSIVKRFGASDAAPCQPGTDGAFARASRGFMGQQWDGTAVAFDPDTWREAYRVLKPGGHLLAMGATRTYHRLVTAIEDAGFEIRDTLAWTYGSGFPKSHNISKALVGFPPCGCRVSEIPGDFDGIVDSEGPLGAEFSTASATDKDGHATGCATESQTVQCPECGGVIKENIPEGLGTALKPAMELICLARKPLSEKSVAANVLRWGTGALNIDVSRIFGAPSKAHRATGLAAEKFFTRGEAKEIDKAPHDQGRFPANFLHDGSPEVLAEFLITTSVGYHPKARGAGGIGNDGHGGQDGLTERSERGLGSAARFFYCAKASKSDREEGLAALPLQAAGMVSDHSGAHITRREEGYERPQRANHHPTVKPTALMRYLVRLVTPPGGTVLDPFTGSGSTGKAALLEGFNFIGCEMTPEYVPIAEARLAHALTRSSQPVIP